MFCMASPDISLELKAKCISRKTPSPSARGIDPSAKRPSCCAVRSASERLPGPFLPLAELVSEEQPLNISDRITNHKSNLIFAVKLLFIMILLPVRIIIATVLQFACLKHKRLKVTPRCFNFKGVNRMSIENFDNVYQANRERFLEELKEFLKFKSIGTEPECQRECQECAAWLKEHLNAIGLETRLLETPGLPVVYAEKKLNPTKPTLLFYGHYDVQPVDPLELWQTDPFEPVERDGRLYARGAQDNKGQLMYFIKALEESIKNNMLQYNVKLVIEGEEENSSRGISAVVSEWSDLLKADVLLVCDTDTFSPDCGTISMGLRGIIFMTVKLSGPRMDLHSGAHGGAIPNPATELARLVSTLHDADGRIAVKGYYDQVDPVSDEERKLIENTPFNLEDYTRTVGVRPEWGEPGFSPLERIGFRPTVELNGIHSGYGGPGAKTIIPAEAFAKITSRLVASQDPEHALDLLKKHLESHAPAGLKLEFSEMGAGGKALKVPLSSAYVKQATKILEELFDGKVYFCWQGGSVPIVSSLAEVSGAEPVLVGFGLTEDNIHAPNESFSLEQFRKGFIFASMFLSAASAK
ncbi:MAG: dipeptidase [Candidatus Dadabacteria bacterium]|nr:MAG: dipeptidase [Candidatus Dadabacteria bacterium]